MVYSTDSTNTSIVRAIRYCSTYSAYIQKRETLRIMFLLNRYPNTFIDEQFNKLLLKFNINQSINSYNYSKIREEIIEYTKTEKMQLDNRPPIFIHFTFCLGMKQLPKKLYALWNKYFGESPIADLKPILGARNTKNLQQRLVNTRI